MTEQLEIGQRRLTTQRHGQDVVEVRSLGPAHPTRLVPFPDGSRLGCRYPGCSQPVALRCRSPLAPLGVRLHPGQGFQPVAHLRATAQQVPHRVAADAHPLGDLRYRQARLVGQHCLRHLLVRQLRRRLVLPVAPIHSTGALSRLTRGLQQQGALLVRYAECLRDVAHHHLVEWIECLQRSR
jgi:hypothetical protein